jgi:type 1 glutamine amidotransferase
MLRHALLIGSLLFPYLNAFDVPKPDHPLQVLILGEGARGGRSEILREALERTGRFRVTVNEAPRGLSRDLLETFQVVLVTRGSILSESDAEALKVWVSNGGGMALLSAGLDGFQEHIGAGRTLAGLAALTGWSLSSAADLLASRHSFRVAWSDVVHPVVPGAGTFLATDPLPSIELTAGTSVLATASPDAKQGGTARRQPVLWVREQGKGRVLATTLGATASGVYENGFLTMLARGIEWTATGTVSLSSTVTGYPQPDSPIRVTVVTGGHHFETTFYMLFEGHRDLWWTHFTSNTAAFEKDFRQSCDVLVLYDLSREIGETQKANLRNFVESGKGLVVLHHAIADYNDWPWWYEEVVGGKFFLKSEGDHPASVVAKDQHLISEAVGAHAITEGVAPLHTIEETYKGMWISPHNKVLLRTDNPTSDEAVAWISPYPHSRVVYIEMGHDRKTHLHPGYRQLVKNAILWTAGR